MATKVEPQPSELKLVSVSGFAVENTFETQCQFFFVGIDRFGGVWFRRNTDDEWTEDAMMRKQNIPEPKGQNQ